MCSTLDRGQGCPVGTGAGFGEAGSARNGGSRGRCSSRCSGARGGDDFDNRENCMGHPSFRMEIMCSESSRYPYPPIKPGNQLCRSSHIAHVRVSSLFQDHTGCDIDSCFEDRVLFPLSPRSQIQSRHSHQSSSYRFNPPRSTPCGQSQFYTPIKQDSVFISTTSSREGVNAVWRGEIEIASWWMEVGDGDG